MIDKVQKIREEVEKLFNHVKDSDMESDSGAFYYLKDLLDLIDSLQEEPVNEDLEDAAYKYADTEAAKLVDPKEFNDYFLQHSFTGEEIFDAFKAGANWKEQQMMAKAIDGKVIANGMGKPILHLWDKGRHLIDKKVKVILVKEDWL